VSFATGEHNSATRRAIQLREPSTTSLFTQPSGLCALDAYLLWYLYNPFTAKACKIAGLKDARLRLQTVYFPVQ